MKITSNYCIHLSVDEYDRLMEELDTLKLEKCPTLEAIFSTHIDED